MTQDHWEWLLFADLFSFEQGEDGHQQGLDDRDLVDTLHSAFGAFTQGPQDFHHQISGGERVYTTLHITYISAHAAMQANHDPALGHNVRWKVSGNIIKYLCWIWVSLFPQATMWAKIWIEL